MRVFCLRTGRSPKKGYFKYISSLTAATFSPKSRWGGWVAVGGGWGESLQTGQKSVQGKIRPFIRRLSASQTSEHFLSEIKDVAY
jgi:hypothetical protein